MIANRYILTHPLSINVSQVCHAHRSLDTYLLVHFDFVAVSNELKLKEEIA